jgi:hypothetical protein
MTNSAESSKTGDSKPSSPQCQGRSTFLKWFLAMVERAENQGVKIEPLSEKEQRIYNK